MDEDLRKVVGEWNANATHWRMWKKFGDTWRPCEHLESGVYRTEWPLSDLKLEDVRAWWHEGLYQARWIIRDDTNPVLKERSKSGGRGRVFRIGELEEEAPSPPPPATPDPFAATFAPATQLMAMIDQKAAGTIDMVTNLANLLNKGNDKGGGDPQMFMLLMQQQAQMAQQNMAMLQQSFLGAMQEMRREQAAANTALLARIDDLETDDEPEPPAAPGPLFSPGEPWGDALKAAIGNALVEHGPSILAGIAEARARAQAPQATPPTQPPPPPPPPLASPNGGAPRPAPTPPAREADAQQAPGAA